MILTFKCRALGKGAIITYFNTFALIKQWFEQGLEMTRGELYHCAISG
jgi:hypothetical protein